MSAVLAVGTIIFATTIIDSEVADCNVVKISGIEDISTFDDPDAFKKKIGTFLDWNGTMKVLWKPGCVTAGATGALAVTITDGPSYSGNVIITNVGNALIKNAAVWLNVTFEGNGTLT